MNYLRRAIMLTVGVPLYLGSMLFLGALAICEWAFADPRDRKGIL